MVGCLSYEQADLLADQSRCPVERRMVIRREPGAEAGHGQDAILPYSTLRQARDGAQPALVLQSARDFCRDVLA